MSYLDTDVSEQPRNLAVTAAELALRGQLRPFLNRQWLSFAILLHLPELDDRFIYEEAARTLLGVGKVTDENGQRITAVYASESLDLSPWSVVSKMKRFRQLVICHHGEDAVNADIRMMLDLEINVAPPTARHFLAAARMIHGLALSAEDAEFLAKQPLRSVCVATHRVRPIRRILSSLSRQSEVSKEDPPGVEEPDGPTLEALAGYGEAKDWGLELARDLRDWQHGSIAWHDLDQGILLSGPPGVGKTYYAQALANSCKVPLFLASAARWQAEGHLGDLLKAMRKLFEKAAKSRPSIVFLDEFDSFGSRSVGEENSNNDYKRQVINGLLECLAPSEGREGVVVIGATNNPGAIDPALLRPGRLERVIAIPLPDLEARIAIMRHHLGFGVGIDLSAAMKQTRGWTGADLMKLARDAKRISRRRGGTFVSGVDLEAAMPASWTFSDDERFRIAVHEVGHALVGHLLQPGNVHALRVASFRHDAEASVDLGETRFNQVLPKMPVEEDFHARITVLLGGLVAEQLVLGGHSTTVGGSAASDLAQVTRLASMMELLFGFGDSLISHPDGNEVMDRLHTADAGVRKAVKTRLETCRRRAFELLEPKRETIRSIAHVLAGELEMNAARFSELVDAREALVSVHNGVVCGTSTDRVAS